jgi:hypothetical protein
MKLVTITDDSTDPEVQRVISTDELEILSGVALAAFLFPGPTNADIDTVNDFLDHHRR